MTSPATQELATPHCFACRRLIEKGAECFLLGGRLYFHDECLDHVRLGEGLEELKKEKPNA